MGYHEHLGRKAPDYDLVSEWVAKVLVDNSIYEPPVQPLELARNYKTRVLFADFGDEHRDVAGFLDYKKSDIYVNTHDAPRRQTFTIAHELGHVLLHGSLFEAHPEEYRVLLRSPIAGQKDPLEQEANAFAANLLVPRFMLDKYYQTASKFELARLFNVSEDVIRFRLAFEYKLAA
jgi:Zn-dependent peptidase ImmA (M78 family)